MARTKVTIKKPDFDKWKNAVEELTVRTGLKIEEIAKETAPVDTGNYRSQITYDGSNTVIAQAQYSADLEYGTSAHEIRPQSAQALHFKQNGKDVFYKKVNHPGTRPKPVMRNAAKETQKQIPEIWEKVQKLNGL